MTDVAALVQEGLEHHQDGRLQRAASLYLEALARDPAHAEANHLLGLLLHQTGRRAEAVERLERAAAAAPDNASYHSNLGVVLQALGRLAEADRHYARALALDPGIAAVHSNRGVVLHGLGRLEEAEAAYRRALALDPRHAEAHANLGLTLQALGRREEAAAAYRQALALRPRYAKALGNLGNVLREMGETARAIATLKAALAIQPLDAGLHNNLGIALMEAGQLGEAIQSYGRALAQAPDFAEAHANLGRALTAAGEFEAAIASYRAALAQRPDTARTVQGLGEAQRKAGRIEEAVESFARALALDPRSPARYELWSARGEGCDWHEREALLHDIRREVEFHDPAATERSVAPFRLLGLFDDPELHRKAATNYTRSRGFAAIGDAPLVRPPAVPRPAPERIRLGYVSADFHDHPTAYLIAELFELHDRGRFEVHAIALDHPPEGSAMRARLRRGVDGFHELPAVPARDVAQKMAELGIDIAIDINGYTKGARTAAFAFRPAPVQVQYLGFPGTMGADFIDYVVADRTVIPEAEQVHYAERIAYLPHSYQVNDRQRPLPSARPTRAACGLPDEGFVFACFNASYKITPEMFSIWMRLLLQVEGSVLWLFESNAWAAHNLQAEAAARGVAPERLVFAGRLPLAAHLARIGAADLFLDTLPYNAHTTASDALWAGLPVLTTPGRSFASRVGASLLRAVGMEELIAASPAEYEQLALALAHDPARLQALRQRLVAARPTAPLFDTPAFTRHLEAAYMHMWQLHRQGRPPETFAVDAGT